MQDCFRYLDATAAFWAFVARGAACETPEQLRGSAEFAALRDALAPALVRPDGDTEDSGQGAADERRMLILISDLDGGRAFADVDQLFEGAMRVLEACAIRGSASAATLARLAQLRRCMRCIASCPSQETPLDLEESLRYGLSLYMC
jgi:hypothetical protein